MQFTTILIAAFAILGANAAPAPNPWGTPSGGNQQPPSNTNTNKCDSGSTAMCCNNGIGVLALNCVLMASLSGGCHAQSLCCQSYGSGSANNCYENDGTQVSIPVNVYI